ncbi:MAG: hypothetical protein DCF30_11220, partial [Hyphomicrobiales bacterium]
GGNIGTDVVAKAEPNGDTLLIVSVGMATNQYLYAKLNYDPVKDLTPVTMVAMVPNLLVVNKELPVQTVAELVAYAKANPGKLTYGSSGIAPPCICPANISRSLPEPRWCMCPIAARRRRHRI